ncbi:TcmI family type II polyketide cyclase [Actinomadura graeca]|uniref:TcmI family type II polyketide cyclase n=2 Tax=Actinomadura graeca TaxID=2750812 RepID=A0ABX8QUV9_9ACTN|nr:TcmI family type II polyketide cyclase [Actinomadura graeca]
MTDRILIVARMRPDSADDVAGLFGASDETELPRVLGVTRRNLFRYRDLYFHYAEFSGAASEAMSEARRRDDFRKLSDDLGAHIAPFDPATWRSPADAMAEGFYEWTGAPR